jgi:hypothetical protein
LIKQAALARKYGIEGFMFHHWFDGKIVLKADGSFLWQIWILILCDM